MTPFWNEARLAVLATGASFPSYADFLQEVEKWRLAMVEKAASP